MTRSTKLYFIVMFIMIVLTIGYGLSTKYSFTGEYLLNEVKSNYRINDFVYYDDEDSVYFNESIINLKELEDSSDLIVKVRKVDDSKLFYNSIETSVEILDIYGNDELEIGDYIYIQEPVSICYLKGMENIISIRGYTLINNNQEYIMFLKHLDKVDGYKYKDKEKITYIPVSTRFSKYCLEEKPVFYDIDKIDNGEISFGDINNVISIFINKDELDSYKQMINKFIINIRYQRKTIVFLFLMDNYVIIDKDIRERMIICTQRMLGKNIKID